MTSIQTTGSHDIVDDEFSFTMCFGDSPTLTFDGLTRDQVRDMRDCLDAMLWHEQDSDYGETLDGIRKTVGPYVSVIDEETAAAEVLQTIRALLLPMVDFSNGDTPEGSLCWKDVEAMITRPLYYE